MGKKKKVTCGPRDGRRLLDRFSLIRNDLLWLWWLWIFVIAAVRHPKVLSWFLFSFHMCSLFYLQAIISYSKRKRERKKNLPGSRRRRALSA